MTQEQMNLIREKFVPYAPRWGSTGYASQDKWRNEMWGNNRLHDCYISGTRWAIITASGAKVVADGTLEGALKAYAKLPENERKPAVEDRGTFEPGLQFAPPDAPPGTVFIQVYCRPLVQDAQGRFSMPKSIDLTEFGGRSSCNGVPGRFDEPQRESLWLTAEEVRSLIPTEARKGATLAVPAPLRHRISLYYLFNWFSVSGGGHWGPKHLQSGDLTLTVEEATAKAVRLRLDGNALFKAVVRGGYEAPSFGLSTTETHQKGLPDPFDVTYDARILGTLEYDVVGKKLTRFDAVALGDYIGTWGVSLKVKPIPVGFAFLLDSRNLPPEGRSAPFIMSALRDKRHYWAPDVK